MMRKRVRVRIRLKARIGKRRDGKETNKLNCAHTGRRRAV